MTPYDFGSYIGALILVYLVSRLVRWLFKSKLGDSVGLLLVSLIVTLVVAVVVGGRELSDTSLPRYDVAISVYGPAAVVWLLLDLLSLRGRETSMREEREAAKKSPPRA